MFKTCQKHLCDRGGYVQSFKRQKTVTKMGWMVETVVIYNNILGTADPQNVLW